MARALSIRTRIPDNKGPRAIELLRPKPGNPAKRRESRWRKRGIVGASRRRRRPMPRALSGQMGSFDRDDFAPWLGARRLAMFEHRQRGATTPRGIRIRPSVGQNSPSGASRRSPDARHRASRRSLPEKPFCRHQIASIWPDSALADSYSMT